MSWFLVQHLRNTDRAPSLESLDGLHAPHRAEEDSMVQSNKDNPFLGVMSMTNALDAIQNSPSVDVLQRTVCAATGETDEHKIPHSAKRKFKLNLLSLNKYRTVEFRQHAGTASPAVICSWADFLLAFVRKSMLLSFAEIRAIDFRDNRIVPFMVEEYPLRDAP